MESAFLNTSIQARFHGAVTETLAAESFTDRQDNSQRGESRQNRHFMEHTVVLPYTRWFFHLKKGFSTASRNFKKI